MERIAYINMNIIELLDNSTLNVIRMGVPWENMITCFHHTRVKRENGNNES